MHFSFVHFASNKTERCIILTYTPFYVYCGYKTIRKVKKEPCGLNSHFFLIRRRDTWLDVESSLMHKADSGSLIQLKSCRKIAFKSCHSTSSVRNLHVLRFFEVRNKTKNFENCFKTKL